MTTNIEVVREIDTKQRCLTVIFNDKHPELLEVAKAKCSDDKLIACKLGTGWKGKIQCRKTMLFRGVELAMQGMIILYIFINTLFRYAPKLQQNGYICTFYSPRFLYKQMPG